MYSEIIMIRKWTSLKLRTKLLIIYLIGSLIPMLVLNGVFVFRIVSDIKISRTESFYRAVNNMSSLIHQYIEDAVVNLHFLYQNKPLYKFIEAEYETQEDFISVYKEYYEEGYRFFTGGPQISSVKVYTDNPTVMNTSEIKLLDSIELNNSWYSKLKNRSPEILLYYNPEKPHIISIVRQMDFFPLYSKWDKIAKIDINIKRIEKYMKDYAEGGTYTLLSPDKDVVIRAGDEKVSEKMMEYEIPLGRSILEKGWSVKGYTSTLSPFNLFIQEDYLLIILIIVIVLYTRLSVYLLSKSFYSRIQSLVMGIHNLNDENIESYHLTDPGTDEIGQLSHSFNKMIIRVRKLIHEIAESKLAQKENQLARERSRFNALLSQINPHYLFNVLETIRMKSLVKKETETAEVIALLSRSYRHLIDWSEDMVPLKTELEIVKEFLVIQKYRFEDDLNYEIKYNDELKSVLVPRYSIQPFVENACIHGLEGSSRQGFIDISVELTGGFLSFRIEDNGAGMTGDKLDTVLAGLKDENSSNSLGIRNIYQRLNHHYSGFKFTISSIHGEGTIVEIIIPQKEKIYVSNTNS